MHYKKQRNPYKIATILLATLLILILIFAGVNSYKQARNEKLNQVFEQGYNAGIEKSVVSLLTETDECKVTSVYYGNFTRQIVDVACIPK